jgi:hypothetical protein
VGEHHRIVGALPIRAARRRAVGSGALFRVFVLAAAFAVLSAAACRSDPEKPKPPPRVSAAPSQKPLDRLAPGELSPGKVRVFGLEVPAGMVLRGQFQDVAYLHGSVAPDALANYVRDRVVVAHVEIGAARTVFPYARIKKGPADRFFQIEVIAGAGRTELVIQDVTPRPTPAEPVSNEDSWRRAGRRPDGRPFDITELK